MLWIVTLFVHSLLVVAKPTENDEDNNNTIDEEFARNNGILPTRYKYGDLKEPQPLILIRNGTVSAIHYPNVNGTLKVNGENRNFSSSTCYHLSEHTARSTKWSCYNRNTHVEIGFNLSTDFLRMIELCRNEKTYNTYCTKFRLTKLIGGQQRSYTSPSKRMVEDYYGKIDIYMQYNSNWQLLCNVKSIPVQRIYDGNERALQSLIFWYINAASQWTSFKAGNWQRLENSIRNFATYPSLDLDVYTGIHGQMTLLNASGKQKDIYLYVNGTTTAVPIPKFYWKIIYDPRSKKGTAFVGLNDPFIKSITEDIYICSDISSMIKWLLWRPNDIKVGISYACTVDDLRKAVPTIPTFQTVGILK
ncbi:uncharacterized protein V1478_012981 [Vespula squamosa]|uniref:DNA/RNA non-specific endonuclease/pyrophosphatase/phosphodiesterase domain-containing protein n=1 Tax=Vespula squamosa TaxID=30214 RepID=A0ABD2A9H4_VESSQ